MSVSGAAREPISTTPTGARACGPTGLAPGWTVEAAASGGNRYAIPTAARKTPPDLPPAFPAATHSPGDYERINYTQSAERRTPTTAKADTFN